MPPGHHRPMHLDAVRPAALGRRDLGWGCLLRVEMTRPPAAASEHRIFNDCYPAMNPMGRPSQADPLRSFGPRRTRPSLWATLAPLSSTQQAAAFDPKAAFWLGASQSKQQTGTRIRSRIKDTPSRLACYRLNNDANQSAQRRMSERFCRRLWSCSTWRRTCDCITWSTVCLDHCCAHCTRPLDT